MKSMVSTSQFTSSLQYQAIFSAVLLLAFLSFRILRILSTILISNLFLSLEDEKNSMQRLAKWGLIGKFANFVVILFSMIIKVMSAFIQTIFLVFYSFIPFIVLGFALMMVQQRWGDSATMLTSILNDPESPVSQTIHFLIRIPLQVLDEVAFYVVPVYNFVVFTIVHIPTEFFANFLFGDGASLVMGGITAFSKSVSLLVQAVADYARANHLECPALEAVCWNNTGSTTCVPADTIAIAASCLDVTERQFNAMPFLTEMMKGFSYLLKALSMGCESMEALINLFCFPLTDPALWKFLHHALNALLYLLVGAPTASTARCTLVGGFAARPSLCTPDFAPAFEYAATASESIGNVIDNFLDMIYLLVFYGKNAVCPSGQSTQHALYLPLWKDPFMKSLFGGNTTALVTLSSSLFALTDGQHSVYVSHKTNLLRSYFPGAWGQTPVNPRFGVASVLNKAGEHAMFACACIDTPSQMVVQCSTLSLAVGTASVISFNSTWEVSQAGQFMQCSTVRILVQSVRWPESRSTMLKQSSPIVDAVVYVIPTCGGDSNILSCLDSRIFTLSNCYPFCMALHHRNTGDRPLLFRGSNSWKNGVLVVDRDCVPIGSISPSTTSSGPILSSTACSSDSSSPDSTLSASSTFTLQEGADMQCNYSPICSSWISNKTHFAPSSFLSSPSTRSIPAFADTERFVRHVLDGQPLVAAGGIFMRVYAIGQQRFVDFPMLVGDRNNEFTVETGSPAGIPVAPVPLVPRLSIASEKKGFISLPPNYIEMVDVFNPATLSMNTLWYAVNPSYNWMSCFAKWCATEGRETCVQIMEISSYTAIRLWKVRYRDSACFVRLEDGVHVCRDDVAVGFPLDPSMDLPLLNSNEVNSQLSGLCSGAEYNLWVESMEYFNELNIAVTVRRGSVKALYHLMRNVLNSRETNLSSPQTEKWAASKELGFTVIYFVHTKNTSLIRALEPWTSVDGTDPGFLSVVHGNAVLCPELRFLPSLGSFVEHSLKAVFHALKMPVNFLSNLFALVEVLIARSQHACPSDGLGHSVLKDCGMGLFDLNPFFTALYRGNAAFWDIVAWMASVIRSSLDMPENSVLLQFFESFVTGVAVYGEAGQVITLFQVSSVAENLFNTGMQDSVLGGGGRRLLVNHENTSSRKLLGAKRIAKQAGKGMLSGIMSVFSGGVKTIFSISNTITGAASLSMSSADFSILLSSMNPTDMLGSVVTTPGIVWAQFTYETVLPMALDIASTLLYSHRFPKSTAVIWVRLNDAKDNYEKLIDPTLTQGCAGLRLMLGYSGGLPTAVYHNCLSATKMQGAVFSLTILLFTEIPFYSCLCVQSAGHPFPDYILANCMDWVPASRKGIWQNILKDSGADAVKMCQWYSDYLHTKAMRIFDEWTTESHLAASALASFLQDLIVPNAREMGACVNTQSNINTFVMLPIPSEHYHVCGKTSDCRTRCADAFAMFDYELKRAQQSPKGSSQFFDVSVESPFFNPYQSASNSLYYIEDRILAVSSRNLSSSLACSTCPSECLVVAKTRWDATSTISVATYCTPPPSNLMATVYLADGGSVWTFSAPLEEPFKLTFCNFALQTEEMYLLFGYTSASMSVASSGIFSFTSASSQTIITQQRLYASRYERGQAVSAMILDTEAMTSSIFSSAIQNYIFDDVKVYNAYVTDCRVDSMVEIASGIRGTLTFFMSIMITAQGWVKHEDVPTEVSVGREPNQQVYRTGFVTAILTWCDPSRSTPCAIPNKQVDYFLPCSCGTEGDIICQRPSYSLGCRPPLDDALFLARRGTFLHVMGNTYLYVPTADAVDARGAKLKVQYVDIDPQGRSTVYPVEHPSGLKYPVKTKERTITIYTPSSPTKAMQLRQNQGTWSHLDVFSTSGLVSRVIKSPCLSNTSSHPIRWFQAAQVTSSSVQWLWEMRIETSVRGFEMVPKASQRVGVRATVQNQCSPTSCASCASVTVKLICHALQSCMLSKCIGTTINYKNILCSVGIVVQQLYMQMVTSWRAVYLFLVEIGMFAMQGMTGSLSQKIVLSFPTDLFYSLVCSCKDVFASVIGMAMSVVESVYGLFTKGRIDLMISNSVTPQDAVHITQTRAIGGLLFNIVADATLYPLLGLHRWILCVTQTTTTTISSVANSISVQFGDTTMDESWGKCSVFSSKLNFLMDSTEIESVVNTDVQGFVDFTMTLVSGIGETLLNAFMIMYDTMIAFLESIVWNIQNIIMAFNLRSCKVSDYMQRVVLQCVCGDTPYYINASQRSSTWSQGALWCSGSLAMTLMDGSQAIIYNPYSLDELSAGLKGVTQYIHCLASATSQTECNKPPSIRTLSVLTNQGVEPIAVWAKCKSNYLEQNWDIAAGALFSEQQQQESTVTSSILLDPALKKRARDWARKVAPEFLQCLQSVERFFNDYSTCLKMYLNMTLQKLPNGYFLYTKEQKALEPPDACMVFSGLNASAPAASSLQETMSRCILDQDSIDPTQCPFNPTVWSATNPSKIPVAKLFGTLEEAPTLLHSHESYQPIVEKLQRAFDALNATFLESAKKMQVALFSADGDFIHDYIDCVFLGPYTRVDMLPCDKEGVLECPFYARDEMGGMHRNFTACFGEAMHGDGELPFTCGSQARRALIKFFFRKYSFASDSSGQDLGLNLTQLIQDRLGDLRRNLTNLNSFGCMDMATGRCQPKACTRENEYTPCLDMEFTISAKNISKFLLKTLLMKVGPFYLTAMHDTAPWTTYYNVSKPPRTGQAMPAQWGASKASALKAEESGLFKPMEPVLAYNASEVYNMPSHEETAVVRLEGSLWSMCMALISQGQMSLPLQAFGEGWRPRGANDAFLRSLDWTDLEGVASAVRNLTRKAADQSPFLWHKARFHAPSSSGMCRPVQRKARSETVSHRIRVGPVEFVGQKGSPRVQIQFPNNLSMPLHGFSWGMLGNAHETCLCGYEHPGNPSLCQMAREACDQIIVMPVVAGKENAACVSQLTGMCRDGYAKDLVPQVWSCLHHHMAGVRCPELGPSDSWGIFPVDCEDGECESAARWVGNAQQDVVYEGIRLALEGRAGLKLPNVQHVNATYHETIDYTRQSKPAVDFQIPRCFDLKDLAKNHFDDSIFDALQDWVKGLFPAAQVHHDSSVVSYCSRFVIEVARAEAMTFVSIDASLQALQDARLWQRKCHSKVKHLAMCDRLGLFYDVAPPKAWRGLYSKHCDVLLDTSWNTPRYFMTPWCIALDQVQRRMYDARWCLRNTMSNREREQAAQGLPVTKTLSTSQLTLDCALPLQPLDMLAFPTVPASSVYTIGGQRLSNVDCVELSYDFDEDYVQTHATGLKEPEKEHISQILDWWPGDPSSMPVGYHVTAPMLKEEMAPVIFDSHYAFDPSTYTVHYVHTALRDHSLLSHTVGTGGLCRAHSVGMPIFETNTNRVCTRMRKGALDSPHLPVDTPKFESDIPPMGPYAPSVLQSKFEAEFCASSYEEVPWPDGQREFYELAGGIPGIAKYLKLNRLGVAVFTSPADTFPPMDAQLIPVQGMYKDWGKCASAVVWDDSPPCYLHAPQKCPRNTLCLSKTNVTTDEGICFSTAAFRTDKKRSPCFRSDHCDDGLVCLADGGCSPLYLHMWNNAPELERLEFALMADDCGFRNPNHPFTQSLRGASPWEQLPDLLHMHGMCSHRNWFAYRNAVKDNVCPSSTDHQNMGCNATEAVWPEVQMRFDGCRISSTMERFTMAQQNVLQMKSHPCDMEYMHAAIQRQRLKVCSGFHGIETGAGVGDYMRYDLNSVSHDWQGARAELLTYAPNTVRWMRTYEESTDVLHMRGALPEEYEKTNTRLGFLGAEIDAPDPMISDMARGEVDFFRCTDRLACQMPDYSYGGAIMDYRLDLTVQNIQNISEASLRRCGAIGSLLSEASHRAACRMDIELFPLFAYIVNAEETQYSVEGKDNTMKTKGCFAIWPKVLYLSAAEQRVFLMNFDATNWRTQVSMDLLYTHPASLFCGRMLCLYAGRRSTVVTEESSQDHVARITQYVNSFLLHTTERVAGLLEATDALSCYESIALCADSLQTFTQRLQASIQVRYNSSITSGFYVAFRISLYEFPQQWFLQCMLTILLSHIHEDIPRPETSFLASSTAVPLAMWSSLQRQMDYCSSGLMRQRSSLYYFICQEIYPEYAFAASQNNLVHAIQGIIKEGIIGIARAQLFENQASTDLECFKTVEWGCSSANEEGKEACGAALKAFYREHSCIDEQICMQDSVLFKYTNKQPFSLSALSGDENLERFLIGSTSSIEKNADKQFDPIPYISMPWVETEAETDKVTLASVSRIDTSLFKGFINTSQWTDEICRGSFLPDKICTPAQGTPLEENHKCIFNDQSEDVDRYYSNSMLPVIKVYLSEPLEETGENFYLVDICERLPFVNGRRGSNFFIYHAKEGGPWISGLDVPPGVMVKAYTDKNKQPNVDFSKWEASAMARGAPPSTRLNCAWDRSGDQAAWWPNAEGAIFPQEPKGRGFDEFSIDFLDTDEWHTSIKTLWRSEGCGDMADRGIYALEVALESPALSGGLSTAHCVAPSPYPMTSVWFNDRKPTCNDNTRAFRVADSTGTTNRHSLWRCAPCTRFNPQLVANGAVGCTLPGNVPLTNLFTEEMLQRTFGFLYSAQDLLQYIRHKLITLYGYSEESLKNLHVSSNDGDGKHNDGRLRVVFQLTHASFWNQLQDWGGKGECAAGSVKMWDCRNFPGYDASRSWKNEEIQWNKMVMNPSIPFTMECQGQKYTTKMQKKCNTKVARKLVQLSNFVDDQYRQKNGVWLQTVERGKGVAWRSNVAHSRVGRFTMFYTSGDRPPREVLTKWVLGEGPCASQDSSIEDRICMESRKRSALFEPMHPWMGGDFNPFEGKNGLDECPFINSVTCVQEGRMSASFTESSSNRILCPCHCSPQWACEGSNFNYSQEYMSKEFPSDDAECQLQAYSKVRVMRANDDSNLCSIVQQVTPTSRGCLAHHGMLGGLSEAGAASVSTEGLHSYQGVEQTQQRPAEEMMHHSDMKREEEQPLLWSGQKLPSTSQAIPFLRMRREFLHPAHIAFGLDVSSSSLPLILKSIALLPGELPQASALQSSWVMDLQRQWKYELKIGIEGGNPSILAMYPQLNPLTRKEEGDWSCPIRKFAFLAGNDPSFGPLTPNPVAAQSIYALQGVHPLIKTQGPYKNLAPYFTTNGACFYREDPSSWPQLRLDDAENQCSLRAMLQLLVNQGESLTSIQESFGSRCNDIIDVPDVGGSMRSGETLPPSKDQKAACGLLHRVTPALIATKGNRGSVISKGPALTTDMPGGDCHTGRAWIVPRGLLQGRRCFSKKNAQGWQNDQEVVCPGRNYTFSRVRPVPLGTLAAKKNRVYRKDLDFLPSRQIFPTFIGPAGIPALEGNEETSFGLLYSASLKEMLSSDLIHVCAKTPFCTLDKGRIWTEEGFLRNYANGTLLSQMEKNPFIASEERINLRQDPLFNRLVAEEQSVLAREIQVWNATDWTWHFLDKAAAPVGKVDRSRWLQNRSDACQASFEDLIQNTDPNLLKDSVKRLSLCAPPPTGDLGVLCTAMTEHQRAVAQKNCQLWGQGDCLANLRMFYLPYMWSSTNQEFSFNTVTNYYEEILSKYFPTQSYTTLCSGFTNNTILETLASLSHQQNALCPASGLEVFKDMLSALKKAGHDLLYMGYTFTMMMANLIASVFTMVQGKDGSFFLLTAGRYVIDFFASVAKLLVPFLDIIIQIFSTISPAGKILRTILIMLCEAYNWIMENIIIQTWCHVVRGVVIGILKAVQAIAFMSSAVVDGINNILKVIGDGSASSCVAYYKAQALAKCPSDQETQANLSVFLPQPLATLCWSKGGGGGIFTGVAESLLSCTSSDTCAKDPLLFDDATKEGLTYCGSCPSVQSSEIAGSAFGCDTYLQRCVCGIVDDSKTECTRNSDCSDQQSSMCGVAERMEGIRRSYISLSCGKCEGIGMQSICMIDGQGASGVCGCANVVSNLMTCMPQEVGTRAITAFSSQLCAAIVDPLKSSSIKNTIHIQSIALDFGEVALAFCSLGGYQNLCMDVSMPISSSFVGFVETPLVVLLQLLSIVTPSSANRRLLSETDLRGHMHAPHDNLSIPVFNEQVAALLLQANNHSCLVQYQQREEIKKCLYWAGLAVYTAQHFNLSHGAATQLLVSQSLESLWTHRNTPGLFPFLLDLNPYTRALQSNTRGLRSFIEKSWGRDLFDRFELNSTMHRGQTSSFIENSTKAGHRRHLLTVEEAIDRGDWSFQCTSLEKPLQKIVDAFWNTVEFYKRGKGRKNDSDKNAESMTNNCSKDLGLASCMTYSLPPYTASSQDSFFQRVSEFALYVPTLGFGGERLLNALLSPMDNAEAIEGDFITGKRILHDMGSCNHTQITLGDGKQRNFFFMFTAMVMIVYMISTVCMPLSCCQWALWIFIFPMFFFWAMYNTSPLCWPMVPTSLVHDMYLEVTYFLPQQLKVPKFLVKPHCTLEGRLEDGSYDPSCFSSCAEPPFLFSSWQDSLMWWVCEISTEQCVIIGDFVKVLGPFFADMSSSSDYYASVINYSSNDAEFVQAHRLCAFFSLYQILFFMLSILISCYLIPTIFVAILEVFMGCVILLMETYIAEAA